MADFAAEVHSARVRSGLSQAEVGRRAGVSADKVWRIEHERQASLSIADACRIAAVLGLDFVGRTYETGASLRDAGQAPRLARLLANVAPPLRFRTDVPLPQRQDRSELRAWDAVIFGHDQRTAIELESRLTDIQATTRRHNLKRRDDAVDHFVLVIASTRHNRRVLREFAELFEGLPHMRTASALKALRAGRHPGTGYILV
jgi:transcriptional regulator with XRE-family HTH domain